MDLDSTASSSSSNMAETCPATYSRVHQELSSIILTTRVQNDTIHIKHAVEKTEGKRYWDHVTKLMNENAYDVNRRQICRMAQQIQDYHLKEDCDCCCIGKSLAKVKLLPHPVVPDEQELNQWKNEDVQVCMPIQQHNMTVGGSSKTYHESSKIETSEVGARFDMSYQLNKKLAAYHFTRELRSDLTKLIINYGGFIIPEILGYTDDEMISFIKSSCTKKYYKKWYEQWSQRNESTSRLPPA
ncbi:uncharacterized protein LOC131005562 isoform X2 [Salvia miltiorrhiza]|nr:uncharacterized protein LOC131005562 isoform X2 [Salvia miltiorrhiza]